MPQTAQASPVAVDVISDVVCPWCYVGKRRLEQAMALRDGQPLAIQWRPFQLDASIPQEGLDRTEYMTRKFGSLDKIGAIHERLEAIGAEVGIPFNFRSIQRSPNTLDAHRLIRWAAASDRQSDVVEGLFRAFFVEGRDIGDKAVLADIAGASGLDRDAAAAHLASGEDADAVRHEIDIAQQLGVRGVPFFVFAGKFAVSGAEAPEVLATAIDKAAGA